MPNRVEEFVQAIEEAEESARQAWLAKLPLKDWWTVMKKEVVRPILADASAALKQKGYHAPDLFTNGHTDIMLQGGNPCSNLSFSLSEESGGGGVVIAFPGSAKEIWRSRGELTDQAIRNKVLEFFALLARQRIEQGGASDRQQILHP